MHLRFKKKFSSFNNFLREFLVGFNVSDIRYGNNFYYINDWLGHGEPVTNDHFIFHPTSMGVVPNNELNSDFNLLESRNKDLLRFHYFSMKAYFIKYCNDPFLRAYYVNLQKEKNDEYYGFMKFYFSKDEVSRRYEDKLCREDDIPF